MQTPEKLLERLGKTPTDPDRLLEYINVVDQKLAEAISLIDNHETNIIRLIIFAEAFKQVMTQRIITEEEFQQCLQQAAMLVKAEMGIPDIEQADVSTEANDIVV
jgi:hypothetical protein